MLLSSAAAKLPNRSASQIFKQQISAVAVAARKLQPPLSYSVVDRACAQQKPARGIRGRSSSFFVDRRLRHRKDQLCLLRNFFLLLRSFFFSSYVVLPDCYTSIITTRAQITKVGLGALVAAAGGGITLSFLLSLWLPVSWIFLLLLLLLLLLSSA